MIEANSIKKSLIILFLISLFLPLTSCQANSGSSSSSNDKLDIELSIDLESSGDFEMRGILEGKTSPDKLPTVLPIEWIEITEGEDYIKIPSPVSDVDISWSGISTSLNLPDSLQLTRGEAYLRIGGSGNLEITLLAKMALSQTTINKLEIFGISALEWLSGNTDFLNSKVSSTFEGKRLGDFDLLKEFISNLQAERKEKIENITLESVKFQSIPSGNAQFPDFAWDGENIYMGVNAVFSGEVFQREGLDNVLPIAVQTSWRFVNDKLQWVLKAENTDAQDYKLSLKHTLQGPTEDNNWVINDNLVSEGEMKKEGDNIVWGLQLLPKIQGFAFRSNLESVLSEHNVELELKAPENLKINDLPSGYTKEGNVYRWENDSAVNAFLSLIIETKEEETGGMSMLWLAVGALIVVILFAVFLLRR